MTASNMEPAREWASRPQTESLAQTPDSTTAFVGAQQENEPPPTSRRKLVTKEGHRLGSYACGQPTPRRHWTERSSHGGPERNPPAKSNPEEGECV